MQYMHIHSKYQTPLLSHTAQLTTTSHTISLWETIILGECTSHDVVIDVGASKTSTHPGGSVKISNYIGPVRFEWVPLSSTLHK